MSATILKPNVRVGDYFLLKQLGKGGMGEVWLAMDERADRRVAIKFIRQHLLQDDPSSTARFLTEARTLGRLEHDRIVTIYRVMEQEGMLALVLRFIDGRSLDRDIAAGPLPPAQVLACARDILPALGFAHDRGIIHRDIKAANILIDTDGRYFLSDFGIAAAEFADRGTMTGTAVGTPSYMSPEQIKDSRSLTTQSGGHRSDIYSFGVLLFEMLTGRVPFPGVEYALAAHLIEKPPSLREINPAVSPAVEAVVLRCLEKDPNLRPQICAHLLSDLEQAMAEGSPPPPVSNRPQATIVEARAFPKPQETVGVGGNVAPPAAARKTSIGRGVWLACGAVVMSAGIGFVAWNQPDPQPKATRDETKAVIKDTPPQQEPVKPTPTPTPTPPPIDVRPRAEAQPAAARTDVGADLLADDARRAGQAGRPCQGVQMIDKAIQLNPKQHYRQIQGQLEAMCGGERAAADAEASFKQGEYCQAQTKIEEAIAANPGASTQYRARRAVMANACQNTLN